MIQLSRNEKKAIWTGLIFSIAAYVLLSYFTVWDIFRSVDFDSMVSLQRALPAAVDAPFSIISLLGSSEVSLLILGIIFLTLIFRKKVYFLGMIVFVLIFIIELMGKLYIFHPGPPKMFFRNVINFHLPIGTLIDTHFSFPSGHMARGAFIGVILLFLIKKYSSVKTHKIFFIFTILFYISLVFISRIYLGEHWLSDVLGGLLLGSAVGLLSLTFF